MIRTEVIPRVVDPAKKAVCGVSCSLLCFFGPGTEPDPTDVATDRAAYCVKVRRFRGDCQDGRPLNCIKSTNIEKIIKSSTIESGLKSALMTGMGD
jgi:hypothetical protein